MENTGCVSVRNYEFTYYDLKVYTYYIAIIGGPHGNTS